MVGLVALQALSRSEDRAVATSTRNLLRSLGGVAGVAISTAVQYAATESALRTRNLDKDDENAAVLDARMKGFQAVFAMLVPLMAICLLGSFFVSDEILKGDEKKNIAPQVPITTDGSKHHSPRQE